MASQNGRAAYEPQLELREAALEPASTCLLFVDCQGYGCSRQSAKYEGKPDEPQYAYWWERMKAAHILWPKLRQLCRDNGIEVMYTVMQSLTKDGRDRSLDYKISGFHIPPGSSEGQLVDCLHPKGDDEILLTKTSSSVFISTNVDYVLRCLGAKQVILCGCLTDQCVESAVRDACDMNFLVTLVTDCCCTYSQERHDGTLRAIKGYCRQRTLQQLEDELSSKA